MFLFEFTHSLTEPGRIPGGVIGRSQPMDLGRGLAERLPRLATRIKVNSPIHGTFVRENV